LARSSEITFWGAMTLFDWMRSAALVRKLLRLRAKDRAAFHPRAVIREVGSSAARSNRLKGPFSGRNLRAMSGPIGSALARRYAMPMCGHAFDVTI
jgi:hypothetical protein